MKKLSLLILIGLLVGGCASQKMSICGVPNNETPSEVQLSVLHCNEHVDVLPVPKMSALVAIIYPFEMRRSGISGEIVATAIIEENGTISSVSMDHASQPEFIEPALVGLKKCVFFPAKRNGVAVRCTAQCRVYFTCSED